MIKFFNKCRVYKIDPFYYQSKNYTLATIKTIEETRWNERNYIDLIDGPYISSYEWTLWWTSNSSIGPKYLILNVKNK